MSTLSAIRSAVATKAAGVAGVRATYSRLPETITATPAIVLGAVRWETTPGEREVTVYAFDLDLYVERLRSDDAAMATADDLIEAVQAAFAAGITLSAAGVVQQALITGGSANEWITVGATEYLRVQFAYSVRVKITRGYTA